MKKSMRRGISSLILSAFLFLQVLPYLPTSVRNAPLLRSLKNVSVFNPSGIDAVGISSNSATLTNPRLSFDALINATVAIGGSAVVVKNSGAGGDYNTRNLFPRDGIKIDANAEIQVASVSSDLVTFTLRTPLVSTANINNHMTASQGGQLKVQFFTTNSIPAGGSIKISVPATSASASDGISLAATSLATSGFDSNGMTNADTTCPGGFTLGTFTAGTGGAPHTFTCNTAGSVAGGVPLTVIIGDIDKPLINPAPISAAHTQGIADIYIIKSEIYTASNGGGTLLEDGLSRVAPIEGVLVTATVDETLQFTVQGVNASSATFCGIAHPAGGIVTTATSVPWGMIASGYTINKNEAVQQLIVTTNAPGGYKVYAEENDQMGDEGANCNGGAPSVEPYTFGASSCIKDAAVGTMSNSVTADWVTPTSNYGFAYAVEGTDAILPYNNTGGVFMARQFADQQNAEDKYATNAELMSNGGPVSSSQINVCYRISIPGTQPAGYYYNKLKFTAIPKF